MSVTRLRVATLVAAVGAACVLAGCNAASDNQGAGLHRNGPSQDAGSQSAAPAGDDDSSSAPAEPKATVTANVRRGAADVPVDRRVSVTSHHGTLASVSVRSSAGSVPGRLSSDKTSWTADSLLEPGTSYTVTTAVRSASGSTTRRTSSFSTQALTLDQQTFPSVFPLAGQTVGVGLPVIVKFDVPVTDHASIERHLHVTSVPAQQGSWHWISNNEVHWRPKTYWKPGTKVTVHADINSVPAGNGIYGQLDRTIHFAIGASHIYKVNTRTDQLRVYVNGKFVRQIPVTTGAQPEFTTRSGIKVITEKLRHTRMNSETIGIDPNGPNGYNIGDVQYAMRLTYSGEFLHAAPWSVYAQGHENVSHGCTGMSLANAAWLFDMSRVGDVVHYTGTDKPMTLTNGFGDWNESFAQYEKGSALR